MTKRKTDFKHMYLVDPVLFNRLSQEKVNTVNRNTLILKKDPDKVDMNESYKIGNQETHDTKLDFINSTSTSYPEFDNCYECKRENRQDEEEMVFENTSAFNDENFNQNSPPNENFHPTRHDFASNILIPKKILDSKDQVAPPLTSTSQHLNPQQINGHSTIHRQNEEEKGTSTSTIPATSSENPNQENYSIQRNGLELSHQRGIEFQKRTLSSGKNFEFQDRVPQTIISTKANRIPPNVQQSNKYQERSLQPVVPIDLSTQRAIDYQQADALSSQRNIFSHQPKMNIEYQNDKVVQPTIPMDISKQRGINYQAAGLSNTVALHPQRIIEYQNDRAVQPIVPMDITDSIQRYAIPFNQQKRIQNTDQAFQPSLPMDIAYERQNNVIDVTPQRSIENPRSLHPTEEMDIINSVPQERSLLQRDSMKMPHSMIASIKSPHDQQIIRNLLQYDNVQKSIYTCTLCNTDFKRRSSLERHMKSFHSAFEQVNKGTKRTNQGKRSQRKRFKSGQLKRSIQ